MESGGEKGEDGRSETDSFAAYFGAVGVVGVAVVVDGETRGTGDAEGGGAVAGEAAAGAMTAVAGGGTGIAAFFCSSGAEGKAEGSGAGMAATAEGS